MSTDPTLAEDLRTAASYLDTEEVRYALGLDYEHVGTSFKQVEVTKTDIKGREYTVLEDVPETEDDMTERIDAHNEFVARLRRRASAAAGEYCAGPGGQNGWCGLPRPCPRHDD